MNEDNRLRNLRNVAKQYPPLINVSHQWVRLFELSRQWAYPCRRPRSKTIYGRRRLPPLSRMSRLASPRLAAPPRSRRAVPKRAVVATVSRHAWTAVIDPLILYTIGRTPRRLVRDVSYPSALWLLANLSMHEWSPLIPLTFYTKDLWPGRRRLACSNTFGIHGLRSAFSLVSVLDKCWEFGRRTIIVK